MRVSITVLEVVLLLILSRPEPVRSQVVPAVFCLAITAAAVGGTIYVYSCAKEKWYCVYDLNEKGEHEGKPHLVKAVCRAGFAKRSLEYKSGPYKDEVLAYIDCETNRQPTIVRALNKTLHFEESQNVKDWKPKVTIEADPECFEFVFQAGSKAAFIRGWY